MIEVHKVDEAESIRVSGRAVGVLKQLSNLLETKSSRHVQIVLSKNKIYLLTLSEKGLKV